MKKLGALLVILAAAMVAIPAWAEEETNWFDMVTINGVIDARIGYRSFSQETDGIDTENVSDIHVFNAGLGAEIKPNEYLSGNLFFLWEEDFGGEDLGIDMDEGFITAEWNGFFGTIGKRYLPVGRFDTYAVTDPLVLEVAECRQSTVGIGYNYDYFAISAWTFNGDFDNVDDKGEPADNSIDSFAASLNIMPLAFQDRYSLALGGYILSDATETSLAFGESLAEIDPDQTAGSGDEFVKYESNVPLYGGFLSAELPFSDMFGIGVVGEYVSTGEFDKEEYLDNAGQATSLSAANIELAALIMDGSIQIGPKFEMISGLDWLETQENDPEYEVTAYNQYGGFAGYDPWDHLHLGLQFMTGSDNEGNGLTDFQFQTVFEF